MRVFGAFLYTIVVLPNFVAGLMFHSTHVTGQWDTWAFVDGNTYYAFYLITQDAPKSGSSPGNGFGVAISSDGVHWKDYGKVHSEVPNMGWEGTGAVWRSPKGTGRKAFLVNFSQCPHGGLQNISFAESDDLIHWTRTPPLNNTWFDIDTRFYKVRKNT